MKSDIILSGVGGQGILSIAAVVGMAALENQLYLKQAEVHGMSQRGGAVQSHLRISEKEIASDLIPQGSADIIISVEPMESLRYLPWLSENGWLVTNSTPFVNIPNYPDLNELLAEINKLPRKIVLNADEIARQIKSSRSSNMVILGAASPFIDIPYQSLENGIRKIFERKGEKVVQLNIDALNAGRDFSETNRK
ncbi:MAG: indolepyruvate oxidoreductase subunit beta [Ignavibacteriota bacterium]|jgi:indolepyruvate ferredoxin oxidoreductase beta subunit|nr:indolepyruvate oxidoreductase subunit beta [Ignavibacteriota bacterium]MBW7842623.1 indolepyruvate oxidoreductase subunit beta [Ignavibacterium sp.]MCO6448687.1 indolepyruvate oxidoreductase subunit beta [Ignavibacterium album]MCZ2269914.1 indolepyruvate oxidoreductase subunit beta [Ignavibacteriales bacterium]MDX9711480.1 indolepyruvate oxidoreductase subunit beta [Ignavibacteriaceae bacterium]